MPFHAVSLRFASFYNLVLLSESIKIGSHVESWLGTDLLLLVDGYLVIELLKQQLWVVKNTSVYGLCFFLLPLAS